MPFIHYFCFFWECGFFWIGAVANNHLQQKIMAELKSVSFQYKGFREVENHWKSYERFYDFSLSQRNLGKTYISRLRLVCYSWFLYYVWSSVNSAVHIKKGGRWDRFSFLAVTFTWKIQSIVKDWIWHKVITRPWDENNTHVILCWTTSIRS